MYIKCICNLISGHSEKIMKSILPLTQQVPTSNYMSQTIRTTNKQKNILIKQANKQELLELTIQRDIL